MQFPSSALIVGCVGALVAMACVNISAARDSLYTYLFFVAVVSSFIALVCSVRLWRAGGLEGYLPALALAGAAVYALSEVGARLLLNANLISLLAN
jgi:hypothetical protein